MTADVAQEDTKAVTEQERFHTDGYFSVFIFVLLLALMSAGILQLIFLLRSTAVPPPVVFSATKNASILEEIPMDKPNMPDNILLNWVADAMMKIHTFNFMNYETVIDEAQEFFIKEGYTWYKEALTQNQFLETTIDKKAVMVSTPVAAPDIRLATVARGRYMWKIRMPIRVQFKSIAFEKYATYDITLVIMRVPVQLSPNGILILKYEIERNNTF